MGDEIEKQLIDWIDNDCDYGDLLHKHFENLGPWEWCCISDEALRILSLMIGSEVEKYSVTDGVISAAAAQSYEGAISAVAAAIGLDPKAISYVVSDWYENQYDLPPPISIDEFVSRCNEEKSRWDLKEGGDK